MLSYQSPSASAPKKTWILGPEANTQYELNHVFWTTAWVQIPNVSQNYIKWLGLKTIPNNNVSQNDLEYYVSEWSHIVCVKFWSQIKSGEPKWFHIVFCLKMTPDNMLSQNRYYGSEWSHLSYLKTISNIVFQNDTNFSVSGNPK